MVYIQDDCWKLIKQYAITWNPKFKFNKCNYYNSYDVVFDDNDGNELVDRLMIEVETYIYYIGVNNALIINLCEDHLYINLLPYNPINNLHSYFFEDDFTEHFLDYRFDFDMQQVDDIKLSFEARNNNIDLILFQNFIKEKYPRATEVWHEVTTMYHDRMLPSSWFEEFIEWKQLTCRLVPMTNLFEIIDYHFAYLDNKSYVEDVKEKTKKLIRSLGLLGTQEFRAN